MEPSASSGREATSIADELLELQQLKDAGALSAGEFEAAKQRLLMDPADMHPTITPLAPPSPVDSSSGRYVLDIGPRVSRFANYQIVFAAIGLAVFLIVLFAVIIPAFQAASSDPGFGPGTTLTCDGPDVNS